MGTPDNRLTKLQTIAAINFGVEVGETLTFLLSSKKISVRDIPELHY
jgi:hypothetical protein